MDPRQSLQAALADRYEIQREIGAGGMATVFLARDLRHERQVALKVLKPELGAVLGVERFLAEIRVTANLQHPHLLPLFDSGEAAGLLFYVMPFVAGESLRQRLEREQQLGIGEAVRIGAAVASALDYAHRNNVVHRDLKPENILLHEGEPVVSDFGIALAVSVAGGARITQTGLSLGTPAYMSPEQAAGDRVVDARSDVYSLGAVVYEMLIGEPPHTGVNVQQVISRVLTERPRSITEQRHTVPEWLDLVILRALAKLPADRFATAREFGEALKAGDTQVVRVSGPRAAPVVPISPARRLLPWAMAGLAASVATWLALRPAPTVEPPPLVRFSVTPPSGLRSDFVELAVSPDGRRLLIAEGPQGSRRVWLRRLNDDDVADLPALQGTQGHFLSPDGGSVAFVEEGKLRTMPVGGGPANTLATLPPGPFMDGGSWGRRGTIVYAGGEAAGLWSVPVTGGAPRRLTTPPEGTDDAHPSFLPDGQSFLFERRTGRDSLPLVMIGTLEGEVEQVGTLRGRHPQWVSDVLMYVTADGTVNAVPLEGRQPVGDPVAVLTMPVPVRGPRGVAFAASHAGVFAFVESAPRMSEIVMVERTGQARPLTGTLRSYGTPVAAPTGSAVAADITASDGSSDIYIYDAGGTSRRVTRDGRSQTPAWHPGGSALAWATRVEAEGRLMFQRLDATDTARVVSAAPGMIRPLSFNARGDSVRAVVLAPRSAPSLVSIDLATGGATPYHNEPGERSASVSPDGHWVTYIGSEDGTNQVFVRPARAAGPVLRISEAGGEQPRWGRGPGTLLYRDSASVVEVQLAGDPLPRVTRRTVLFADRYERGGLSTYDVTADGRLVMLQSGNAGSHVDVLVNVGALVRSRQSIARRNAPGD